MPMKKMESTEISIVISFSVDKIIKMYHFVKIKLIYPICFCIFILQVNCFAQEFEDIGPQIESSRKLPPVLKDTLVVSAYVSTIYLFSRLEQGASWLGFAYFIPSFLPVYIFDEESHSNMGFSAENMAFLSLSAYNFFDLTDSKYDKAAVFRNNIMANVIVWSSVYAYKKYAPNMSQWLSLYPNVGMDYWTINANFKF